MNRNQHLLEAKRTAYQAAENHGCRIVYEVGARHWTVNVEAPDGMVFSGGMSSLVTEWMTPPTAKFWHDVTKDIEDNAPYLETI